MRVTIPTKLNEITVGQFMQYNYLLNAKDIGDDALLIGTVAIFCKLTTDDTIKIPLNEFRDIYTTIENTLQQQPTKIHKFGKFGFIPNFDKITTAEYIDLDKYLGDYTNYHRAMAVLFRPIDKEIGGSYTIKAYEGSDAYCEQMRDAPLEALLSAMVFFWNLSKDLLKATKHYLLQPTTEVETLVATLGKSGVGINQFTQLLEETILNLEMQLNLISTNF